MKRYLPGFFGVLLVLVLLALGACSLTLPQALTKGYVAVSALSDVAVDGFHAACVEASLKCIAEGSKRAKECPGWVSCDTARTTFLIAMDLLEKGMSAVNGAYRAAKNAGVIK